MSSGPIRCIEHLILRFISQILFDPDTGCWEWKGPQTNDGNLLFHGTSFEGKPVRVSPRKFAWRMCRGEDVDTHGRSVTCGNDLCLAPAHQKPWTDKESMLAARAVATHKQAEKRLEKERLTGIKWTPRALIRKPKVYSQKIIDRFWALVEKSDGCWLWTGPLLRDGAGRFNVPGRRGARTARHARAHRFAWVSTHGEIPLRHKIEQTCGNRLCVRHLACTTDTIPPKKLRAVRRMIAAAKTDTAIEAKLGVSHQVVSKIRHEKSYKQRRTRRDDAFDIRRSEAKLTLDGRVNLQDQSR